MSRSALPRGIPLTVIVLALFATAAPAEGQQAASPPPPATFKKVSALVPLPDFIPGLGTLYVDPATLPAGPFFAYDREGHLASTIYMIPIAGLDSHKDWPALSLADASVDHVDIVFNAGHPGVPEPHYHIILWHISRAAAARLAQ